MGTLHEYYAHQKVRPTFANFGDDAELARYEALRNNVFYRLMLPPAVFSGRRLLEFGPDTGENSLVFARWGAHITLVEPNAEAHPFIRKYFSKFKLGESLDEVVAASLLEFKPGHKFDVVDAEGFIYSIQPNSAWIRKVGECLAPDGFLIISYMELYGSFIELLLKAIYNRVIRDPAYGAGIETAKSLFLPKWNSIPHTRKLDSWFMDVIENPFVRRKYCIDPVSLLRDTHAGGFRLYSSWPNYRDMLAMRWIKSPLNQEDELAGSISFVEQSRLSHLLGRKYFLPGSSKELTDALASLMRITDDLIDVWSPEACAEARACVNNIERLVLKANAVTGDKDLSGAEGIFGMAKSVFEFMGADDVAGLVGFCQNDRTFISTWGMPAHYAVFQRSTSQIT